MPYIITITDNNPQALAFVEYAKKLDFTKVSMSKEVDEIISYNEDLEEDEYGIPIKYREEIMAMSKESNRNIARRWREDLAKKKEKQAI
nr:glutaredoxin-2 domain protein [uncultured Capnocytophaga sp.]